MYRKFRNIVRKSVLKAANHYAPPEVMIALKYFRGKGGPVFAKRNIYVADTLPVGPVLVLSPHPDDEAIGMGGTLSRYLAKGSNVTVLYMTDGGGIGDSRSELIVTRRQEAQAVGRTCGIHQIFWDREDTRLAKNFQTVTDMVKVVRNIRPSAVYLPAFSDHHFDHFAANQIFVDALKELSPMSITVFGYEVWDNIPYPNYIIDISEYFERKREILQHYSTPLQATDFIKLVKYRGAVHYMLHIDSRLAEARNGYAEVFCRFDSETYQRLFTDYVQLLKEHRSPMMAHIERVE